MKGFVEYQLSREPDPGLAICSARQSLLLTTDFDGTSKLCNSHRRQLALSRTWVPTGCKPAPRGQFEREELTDGHEQRTSACSKPAGRVGRPERRRRAEAMYSRLRVARKALRHRDDRQS